MWGGRGVSFYGKLVGEGGRKGEREGEREGGSGKEEWTGKVTT